MIKSTLGALLGFIYNFVGNYGLSIIIFTVIVKVLLIPLTKAQVKSQKNMQVIQPKLEELKVKYKNDKEKLNQKSMELYQEYKINPLAGCLPMLIQLPIIFALFGVLREPINYVFGGDAAAAAEATSVAFLWIKDLTMPDTLNAMLNISPDTLSFSLPGLMPILAAILTYLQMKTMNTTNSSSQNNQMQTFTMMMPFMILFFGISMSGGVVLYWVISTLFQIVQQVMMPTNKIEGIKEAK